MACSANLGCDLDDVGLSRHVLASSQPSVLLSRSTANPLNSMECAFIGQSKLDLQKDPHTSISKSVKTSLFQW